MSTTALEQMRMQEVLTTLEPTDLAKVNCLGVNADEFLKGLNERNEDVKKICGGCAVQNVCPYYEIQAV